MTTVISRLTAGPEREIEHMASAEELIADLGLEGYNEELTSGLDLSNLGAAFAPGAEPMDISALVKNPRKLHHARKRAIEHARKNKQLATKHKAAGAHHLHRVHHAAYLHHAGVASVLGTCLQMHVHTLASRSQRANYVTGVSFEAIASGAVTDTATIKSPINDQPWHIVAWVGSLSQLINFNVILWQPTGPDIVSYGAAGVSYATTTPTAGFPCFMWAMESYSLAENVGWQFAPWQRPGYVFGGSATMQIQFKNTAATTQTLRFLVMGQCSPCNTEGSDNYNQRYKMYRAPHNWHSGHQAAMVYGG